MKNKITATLSFARNVGATFFKKMKTYPKISGGFLVITLVTLSYSIFSSNSNVVVTSQEVKVERKDIVVSVSGSGTISPTNTVAIKVKGQGDIRTIAVKAGQAVKQGSTLLSLDASDAYQDLAVAQVNLETAELELEKIRQPAETLDVLKVKNQIATAEQKIKDQDLLVSNAYKTFLNTTLAAYPEIQATSVSAPTISGSYMGGKEGEIKILSYLSGDGLRFTVSGIVTGAGIASLSTPQPLGASGLYITFSTLDPQPTWVVPVPNSRSSSYLSAKTTYENALITKEKTVAAEERTLAELKEQLRDLEDGADPLDIRAKELVVAQKKNDVSDAYKKVSDYIARAPFDGVVASLLAETGDSVTPSTVLGTVITSKKIAEISLNEADIARVSVGQKAKLTFDALDDVSIEGEIVEIDTIGTNTQGVVTYTVKVAFDEKDTRIKPGMTVTGDIILEQKENVLIVPNEAIKNIKGKKVVTLKDGNTSRPAEVMVGTSGEIETEILSGLKEGDIVLVTRRTGTQTTSSAASLFTPPRQAGGTRGL
ncbi:MAG: efflux RND transporter periplasmic adaptor subunit [Candidatus Pacebacteria bacterium]|nr:efflux RND transporter periplasmic adaptor subunit [Candidatus Paceibacterota bacterium]